MVWVPFEEYCKVMPRKRVAGGILCPFQGKYLILKDVKGVWTIPGGVSEREESPYQTAMRETAEEIGLEVEIERFLNVRYIAFAGDNPLGDGLLFTFLGKELTRGQVDALKLQPEEIQSAHFLSKQELLTLAQTEKGFQGVLDGLAGQTYTEVFLP